MDPIIFPQQVREFFLGHPAEISDEDELTTIFKENANVRDEFIEWASVHPVLVQHTPRLYKALDLATAIPEELGSHWMSMAKLVHSQISYLLARHLEDGSSALINSLLTDFNAIYDVSVKKFPLDYWETALELFESGVINASTLIDLLSVKNGKGEIAGRKLLDFHVALDLLKDDLKSMMAFFLIKTDSDNNSLFYHELYSSIPFLERFESKDIVKILSAQDIKGYTIMFTNLDSTWFSRFFSKKWILKMS